MGLRVAGTLFNVLVVFYMLFTGLGTALCATVGKYIGAGRPACRAGLAPAAAGFGDGSARGRFGGRHVPCA